MKRPLSDADNRYILTKSRRVFADIPNIMDVTTISGASAFQQQTIASNVQGSVAAKVLDAEKQAGAGALQLLAAATPQPAADASGHVDIRA